MKIEKFEDLEVWKESMNLSILIYRALKDCKDFGLRDQIQRASVSIPSNIAEGYERKSNKQYLYFLRISQGSCAELRTQLYLAGEIGEISKVQSYEFVSLTRKISGMIHRLIESRQHF
jgi:four helix bundle protein